MATAPYSLGRQYPWRCQLLLCGAYRFARMVATHVPHQGQAHAARPCFGIPLGRLDGVSLLGTCPWRCHPCHPRHHALASPCHQCHHARRSYAPLRRRPPLRPRRGKAVLRVVSLHCYSPLRLPPCCELASLFLSHADFADFHGFFFLSHTNLTNLTKHAS